MVYTCPTEFFTSISTVYDQIEVLEREIRKTERILSKLFDSWELEQISDNEFVQRKAIHNEKIESLKNRIEESFFED